MNSSETKICQNCKSQFTVEPEDFDFYEKIKVPPPTFCPECRLKRRLLFRNEHNLYKIKCGLCRKDVISMYSSGVPFPVYCHDCWWSDKWNPLEFGREVDFNQPFLNQFKELSDTVPREALQGYQNTESDYSNFIIFSKDSYLSSVILECEHILYSRFLVRSSNCVECDYLINCHFCYRLIKSVNCSECTEGTNNEDCRNIHFSSYCYASSDCYGCINLRHKQYCIFNVQYEKDEYKKRVAELLTLSQDKQRAKVSEFFKTQIYKYGNIFISDNVSGDDIYHAKNCKNCFLANYVQEGKNLYDVSSFGKSSVLTTDLYDSNIVGDLELFYEMIGGSRSSRCFFGIINDESVSLSYCQFCYNSSNLFGCIGIRKKSNCILNKQYSKEEYGTLIPKVIESMNQVPHIDARGIQYRYGEFFPAEFSPFAYNESIIQDYFTLNKAEAGSQGFHWKEPEARKYNITVRAEELPKGADDSILKEVIGCAHGAGCNDNCTTAFRITPQELQFYRRMNIALPHLCSNCRRCQRLKQQNPLKLWHRKCTCSGTKSENGAYTNTISHFHGGALCPNEFETSYAPERPEIVYCEQCYNVEVV